MAFDAFPPRLPGETPWADPVLSKAIELQRSTGVAFVSLCMSPLAYTEEAKAFTKRWKQLPFLQGHRASANAIRALLEFQGVRQRAVPTLAAAREPGKGVAGAARGVGAGGRGDRRRAARALRRAPTEGGRRRDTGARRPRPRRRSVGRWRSRRSPRRSRTRRDSAAFGSACAAPARSRRRPPTCSRRRGAAAPARPRCWSRRWCTATRCWSARSSTSSSARRSRSGRAARWPKPARRRSLRHRSPRSRRAPTWTSQAERCGLNADEHDLGAVAKAVESIARATHDLRDRITSLEANPLLVGPRGAVAVDALAEAKPPA